MSQLVVQTGADQTQRLDTWLWASRFFKTRSLATQAVDQGRVKIGGERIKPARELRRGDRLQIQIGEYRWAIEIVGLSLQRGSAPVAQALYREDADSVAARQQAIDARRAAVNPDAAHKGRPSKRDRRRIIRFLDDDG